MFRRISPVAFLLYSILGTLQAEPQLQVSLMTTPQPTGCATQPPAYSSFPNTDAAAYLWFGVDGVSIGDVFASNYYTPAGQFYSATSGPWPAATTAGNYCFIDAAFDIAGSAPASMLGTWRVTVTYNGAAFFSLSFTITGASTTVTISSLTPNSAMAGGPAFTMIVNGTGFVSGATVRWNGSPLGTSYLSGTQLSASVAASLVASPGTANVTVADPGGSPSSALTFTINSPQVSNGMTKPQTPEPTDMCSNPTPSTTAFSATDAAAILWFHVTGVNAGDVFAANYYAPSGQLDSGASYAWSPVPSGATAVCYINWFYIAGQTPASTPGAWTVTVTHNGASFFSLNFTITAAPATVTISSLSPASAMAGGPAFTMTVYGTGFLSGAVVDWNGSPLSTGYVSGTQLSASVPASLIVSQGNASITVRNPGGAASNVLTFPIAASLSAAGSIPQIASGGGSWTTTITLVNTGTQPAQATLNFFDDNGDPLQLPLTFPQNSLSPMTASTLNTTLNAGAGLIVETAGLNDPLLVGWAQLLTNGNIGGFAVFTDAVTPQLQQEAVVPLESRNAAAYVLWFDNVNGFATGAALANLSTQSAEITVVVRDDTGTELSTQTITLPAEGHTSFDLATQFAVTANRRGTLEFDTPLNGQISVLGLRFNPADAFTSIPLLAKSLATKSLARRSPN